MSANIDERVVKMEFDNKDFEKAVSVTLESLDKLEEALKLEGSSKGIEQLQKSFNNFETKIASSSIEALATKFNKLGIVGVTALTNIVNKAVDAGEKMVKALTVDNVAAGWKKFAENTKNIGTIVSQGYSMSDVEKEMKRLMFFTDETSYSYADMVNNISKFTAAGKSLHDSVDAMQGIALWAGSAGVNAQKASMAMYQLSQALGAGYMRKEDWKSIQNYNMDIKEFREMALEAGVAAGTLKKSADGMYESLINPKAGKFDSSQFAEHLTQDKWFTDEVMMSVYARYNEAVQKIYEYVQKNNVTTAQAIEELSGELDPLAIKWFRASQEARTFGDAIDYVKEAVSTGWMRTFELIFGNYKEATALWTSLSDTLYTVFVEMNDVRNGILEVWKALGGRDYLLIAVEAAFKAIASVVNSVRAGIERVFEPLEESEAAQKLFEITEGLVDFFYDLQLSEHASQAIADIFEGLASVVKLVIDGFKGLINILKPLGGPIKEILGFALDTLAAFGRTITQTVKWIETASKGSIALENFGRIARTVLSVLLLYKTATFIFSTLTAAITTAYTALVVLPTKVVGILGALASGFAAVVPFIPVILGFGAFAFVAYNVHGAVMATFGSWPALFSTIADWFKNLSKTLSPMASAISNSFMGIPQVFQNAKTAVIGFAESFVKSIDISRIVSDTRKRIDALVKSLTAFSRIKIANAKTSIGVALIGVRKEFAKLPSHIKKAAKSARSFFNIKEPDSGISKILVKVTEGFEKLKGLFGSIGEGVGKVFSKITSSFANIKSFDDLRKKVTDTITSFKGFDTVIALLGRFGETLSNVGTKMTPKFGNLGSVMGSALIRLGQLFKDIQNKFDFAKLFSSVVNGFKNFGLIIGGVISSIIPALRNGAEALGLFHTQTRASASGALEVAGLFQQMASRISASLSDVYQIIQKNGGLIQMFVDALAAGFNRLKQAVNSFLKQTGLDVYVNQLITWLEPMLQYIGKLEPAQLILLAFGITVAKMAANTSKAVITVSNSVSDFLKSAKAVPKTLTGIFKEISSTVKTFGSFLQAIPKTLTTIFDKLKKAIRARNLAKDFLRVALGISALALSLGLLAKYVDPNQLAITAGVIGTFILVVALIIQYMEGIDTKGMGKMAFLMMSLAVSISILAGAVAILSHLPIDQFALGAAMIGTIAYGLVKALEYFGKIELKSVASIVGLCIGLAVAFDALALGIGALAIVMSFTTPEAISGAISAVMVFLVGVAGIVALTSKIPPTAALSIIPIIGIVMSLYLLMGAIILIAMSPISPEMIIQNLEKYAIVIGALAVVIVVANKLSSSLKSFGLAIIGISIALGWLVKVVKQISEIKFDGIIHYFEGMAIFKKALTGLLVLMLFSRLVSKAAVRGAVALMGIALSLRILMFTMTAIKKLVETTRAIDIAGILVIQTILVSLLSSLMITTAFTRYAKVGPILALIAALSLMTMAITLISLLPWQQIGKMAVIAVSLGVFFGLMGKCFEQIAQASFYSNKTTILAFAAITVAIVGALIYLTTVPWNQVIAAGAGLLMAGIGIGGGLLMIANAAKIAKDSLSGALAIMATALALIPAAMALSQLATFDPIKVIAAAVGLGIIMLAIAGAGKLAGDAIIGAVALLVASISLIPAAMALQQLQGFNGPEIIDAAFALGLVLVMVAGGAAVASQAIIGAAALFIASLSLVGAADALTALAAIDSNALKASTEALINVLMSLAVAGFIAGIPTATVGLMALAAALVVLALAFTGIADASLRFATAMTMIMANLTLLATMSDETVDRIINNMMRLSTAVGESVANAITSAFNYLFTAISQAASGILGKIGELITGVAGQRSRMEWAGSEICAGAAAGIQNGTPQVEGAMRQMGDSSVKAYQDAVGVHSPSTLFAWIMEMCCAGAVNGIDTGSPQVQAAMRQMGQNVLGEASSIFSYENGASIASVLVAGIKNTIAQGIADARHMLADFNAMAQASSMDPVVAKKGKVYLAARSAAKDQERMERDMEKDRKKRAADRQASLKKQGEAAISEQERLEKEMGWNQPKDPFEQLFGDQPGGGSGGSGGGGGGAAEKAVDEVEKQIDRLTNIMDYASEAVGIFNNHWALGVDGLSNTQAFNASKDALEMLALQLYETSIASETAEEAAERMGKSQAEVAADVKKAYLSVRNGIAETLKGQIDLFKMADFGEKKKGGDLLEMARSQERLATSFSQSFETLSERVAGLDGAEELLRHFKDEGMTAMGDLSSVLDMTSEELKEFAGYAAKYYADDATAYTNMADRMMADMANVAYKAAGGFKEGLNPEEAAEIGDEFGHAALEAMRARLGVNLQGGESSEVTKEIGSAMAKGLKEGLESSSAEAKATETEAGALGDKVTEAIDNTASTNAGKQIGVNLCEGIAEGIRSGIEVATTAAEELALKLVETVKNALGIASPSKVFADLGYYSDLGLSGGLTKYGTIVREAAADTALGAVDEMSGVFGRIADVVDGTIDLDPTIRPVLDLTNLQYGATQIGSLLGLNDPYALNAVAGITGIQNDASLMASLTGSLTDAINGMKKDQEAPQVTINIYPQEGQSAEEIAEEVSWRLNHDVIKRRAVYGGT